MFKITVSYIDFNDKPRNEDLYFHMMAPEFVDLEFNPMFDGSLSDYIRAAMASGEGEKVYTFFKMMVVNSYGRRSADGSEFEKKPEWTEKFLNSQAWEQFFLWLTDDPKNAEKFWLGIFPKAMQEKLDELEKAQGAANGTKKALQDMSKEELVAAIQKQLEAKKPANEA